MSEGLTSAGIERLRAAAEQHLGPTRVPGLVALVARGEEVHVEALGELSVGGRAVKRDSIGSSWLVDPARELIVIVLTQRMFETSQTPQVHRDIQAAAYAAVA